MNKMKSIDDLCLPVHHTNLLQSLRDLSDDFRIISGSQKNGKVTIAVYGVDRSKLKKTIEHYLFDSKINYKEAYTKKSSFPATFIHLDDFIIEVIYKPYRVGQGGVSITSADWEQVIALAYNRLISGQEDSPLSEFLSTADIPRYNERFDALENEATKIARDILESGFPEKYMKHFGSGQGNLSKLWTEWGGTDRTPKTDMYIGNTHTISLKKIGNSQLMSGGKGETLATFYSAFEHSKQKNKNLLEHIVNTVDSLFVELYYPKTINMVRQKEKRGEKLTEIEQDILDRIERNKKFTISLRQMMNEHQDYKKGFLFESLTGAIKFQDTPLAIANHIVIFDERGENNIICQINHDYAEKIGSEIKFNVVFKSHGGPKKRTVLRALVE